MIFGVTNTYTKQTHDMNENKIYINILLIYNIYYTHIVWIACCVIWKFIYHLMIISYGNMMIMATIVNKLMQWHDWMINWIRHDTMNDRTWYSEWSLLCEHPNDFSEVWVPKLQYCINYIFPKNAYDLTVFFSLYLYYQILWSIYPYPSGLLHWHWENWLIINQYKARIQELCAHFLWCTVFHPPSSNLYWISPLFNSSGNINSQ